MELICVTTSKTFPRAWGQLFPRAINKKIVFGLFGGSWVIQKYFQGQTWDISKGRQQRFPCADISIGLPLEILSVSEVRQKTPFYFWRPLLPLEKTKPADGKSENSSSDWNPLVLESTSSALTQKRIFWVNRYRPSDCKRSLSGAGLKHRGSSILVQI